MYVLYSYVVGLNCALCIAADILYYIRLNFIIKESFVLLGFIIYVLKLIRSKIL